MAANYASSSRFYDEEDEPSHVSQTPTNTDPYPSQGHKHPLATIDSSDLATSLRSLLSDYDAQKSERERLEGQLVVKNDEIAKLREEIRDMRGRLQKTHDSMEHAARFAAWIASVKPDFMDYAVTCHGCTKSEYDGEVKKYFCNTPACQPLNLCNECAEAYTSCIKCKQRMMDERGYKKRRLPPSWEKEQMRANS
jgi:hypothetical protein